MDNPNRNAIPNCEQCKQLMVLKFTTVPVSEAGKVSVYECIACQKLAFIPYPIR
jgi:hypothetical protein